VAPADWESRCILAAQVCSLAYASGFLVALCLLVVAARAFVDSPERTSVCIFTSACAAHTVESGGSGYAKAS
jgi:hypothetical protein